MNMDKLLLLWEEYGFNASFAVLALLIVALFLTFIAKRNERTALFKIEEKDESQEGEVRRNPLMRPFESLEEKIKLAFLFKPNEKRVKTIYYSILGAEVLLIGTFILTGKYLLAIILPTALHYLALKAVEMWTRNIHDHIQEELPIAIRHFIKIMTKTSDLRIVTYEAGKAVQDPLRSSFLDASRKMSTESPEKVLMDLADKLQNSWVHAFVFILASQKESSRKKDVVKNLALLAEIIDTENRLAEKAVVEKKGMVFLNWTLVGLALAGFVANMIWVDTAHHFFFGTIGGMFALLFGFIGVFLTVIINIALSKKKI